MIKSVLLFFHTISAVLTPEYQHTLLMALRAFSLQAAPAPLRAAAVAGKREKQRTTLTRNVHWRHRMRSRVRPRARRQNGVHALFPNENTPHRPGAHRLCVNCNIAESNRNSVQFFPFFFSSQCVQIAVVCSVAVCVITLVQSK
jgi:hypothetical protein